MLSARAHGGIGAFLVQAALRAYAHRAPVQCNWTILRLSTSRGTAAGIITEGACAIGASAVASCGVRGVWALLIPMEISA